MALSDLAVFSEFVYSAQREVLMQQIELFNAATRGAISLSAGPVTGDYHTEAFWSRIHGLVRRRNPYGSGTVTAKELAMLQAVSVKVAAGTPPINIPPSMFRWIQENPAQGGAQIGQQLAVDTLGDMLNTALLAAVAAMLGEAENIVDITGATAKNLTHPIFNTAQALFGDHYQDITTWVMHSKPLFDIYTDAMSNSHFLFNFGSVGVKEDAFGRTFVITDSASLVAQHTGLLSGKWQTNDSPDDLDATTLPSPGSPTSTKYTYATLGLVPGAIAITQNEDFDDNVATLNGNENIARTYQAEWSYNLGLKGFKWDTANGSHAPNDAALSTQTNWDRYATNSKSLPGVLIKSH